MKWKSGWHVNANLRAGYAKTEQSAALYSAGTNSVYDIDSGSYYIGGELGLGKIIDVGVRHSIDWYGKYIYLHQGSNSFYAGGEYDVKGINSYRLQLAGRYNYDLGKRWFLYAGLGGEYEFDGEGRVWADGLEVEPTKNKGMRGIGELGVKLSPEDSGFSIDVSVKGSIGKFRSALFGLEMKYEF